MTVDARAGASVPRVQPSPSAAAPRVSLLRTMPRLLGGLVVCAAGVAMMIRAELGLGPWDVLHQGLAVATGISVGVATILVGAVVLLLWFPLRQRPGVGTVINVLMIGTMLDVFLGATTAPEALWLRWLLLLTGPVVFGIGVGLYIGAGIGTGPRDGVMTGLELRGIPIAAARTAIELSALLGGWLLGGTVGIGTLYFAFTVGPVMHVAIPRLRAPWFPPGTAPRVLGAGRS